MIVLEVCTECAPSVHGRALIVNHLVLGWNLPNLSKVHDLHELPAVLINNVLSDILMLSIVS